MFRIPRSSMLFLSSIVIALRRVCLCSCVRSDLSASAVLYAHDRYCRGLGRVLVLIIHSEVFDAPDRGTNTLQTSQENFLCEGQQTTHGTGVSSSHDEARRRHTHSQKLARASSLRSRSICNIHTDTTHVFRVQNGKVCLARGAHPHMHKRLETRQHAAPPRARLKQTDPQHPTKGCTSHAQSAAGRRCATARCATPTARRSGRPAWFAARLADPTRLRGRRP